MSASSAALDADAETAGLADIGDEVSPDDSIPLPSADFAIPSAEQRTITEGSARILFPGPDAVFYNKVQILNRDLSIAAIRAWIFNKVKAATSRDVRKAWARVRAAGVPMGVEFPEASVEGAGGSGVLPIVPGSSSSSSGAPVGASLPGMRVLEALAASGLRSVRYAKEIAGIDTLVVNDFDAAAIDSIRANMAYNGLGECLPREETSASPIMPIGDPAAATEHIRPRRIIPSHADAIVLLMTHKQHSSDPLATKPGGVPAPPLSDIRLPFDIVDLDPYGTASPFLDAAVQSIADGGLLAVTCTDMSVLAGNHLDSCHGKYGSIPLRARHYQEQALRIVLASIETAAVRHQRVIKPMLSISADFYVRVFVQVTTSSRGSTLSPRRLGHLYQCAGCDAFWVWPLGRWPSNHKASPLPPPTHSGDGTSAGASSGTGGEGEGGADAVKRKLEAKGSRREKGTRVPAVVACDVDGESSAGAAYTRPTFPITHNSTLDPQAAPGPRMEHVHGNTVPPLPPCCPHCDRPIHMGGPIWLDPIHDKAFAQSVLEQLESDFAPYGRGQEGATHLPAAFYDLTHSEPRPEHDAGSNSVSTVSFSRRRLQGMLRAVVDELHDVPLYYEISSLISHLHLRAMPYYNLIHALRQAGYATSESHTQKGMLKTTAPMSFIWDVLREWEKQPGMAVSPLYRDNVNSLAYAILNKPRSHPDTPVVFPTDSELRIAASTAKHAKPMFLGNPGSDWGPGSRASSGKAAAVAAGISRSVSEKPKPQPRRRRPGGEEAASGGAGAHSTAGASVHDPDSMADAAVSTPAEAGSGDFAPPEKRARLVSPVTIEAELEAKE